MSYTIVYKRVFLRSGKGITPCYLKGDNNCWDPLRNRRPRDWRCLNGFLGASEETILAWLDDVISGEDCEFYFDSKKGAFMHSNGFRRWVMNSIKHAVTVENFCKTNNRRTIPCCVCRCEGLEMRESHMTYCSTSEELDAWIDSVSSFSNEWFPVIQSPEDAVIPKSWPDGKPFLLKSGNSYVTNIVEDDKGYAVKISFSKNILNAKRFQSDTELPRLMYFKDKYRKVRAEKQDKPNNVALRITDGTYAGKYAGHRTSGKMCIESRDTAQRFEDLKAAEKARPIIERRFHIHCEPIILDETTKTIL